LTRTQRQIEQHRQADAVFRLVDPFGEPLRSVPVWVEQESHAFPFGCVAPGLTGLSERDRERCQARLAEFFNRIESPDQPPPADALRVEVADRIHLGTLRLELDRQARDGLPLEVHVRGRAVGLAELPERDSARRLTDLYALCFAHAAVRGIVWHGLRDGEAGVEGGLLRADLSPRAAFRSLQKLIDVVWHTRTAGGPDSDGLFRFRGFCGGYRVGVRPGERTEVLHFSLAREPVTFAPSLVVPPDSDERRE
jgi:hypothetical protein